MSALVARKKIEALYGEVSFEASYNDEENAYWARSEWDFSFCNLNINTIEKREEILLYLDRDIVETELQIRYDAIWYSSDRYSISDKELDEIVMWAKNGYITYNH